MTIGTPPQRSMMPDEPYSDDSELEKLLEAQENAERRFAKDDDSLPDYKQPLEGDFFTRDSLDFP